MLGTIVNAVVVLVMGTLGLIIKSRLSDKYKHAVLTAIGISVMFVGASGAIKNMMLDNANPVLFIISLVVGVIIGTLIGIDKKVQKLGNLIQRKFAKKSENSSFTKAFTYSSVLFCAGTMSILGSIESGTQGVHTTLFAKASIDGITAMILASTEGIGVLFSAIPILIYQGAMTLLAGEVGQYLTADMLREIGIVGGIVITCIGIDMIEIKKIKIANFLPAIFIPIIYYAVIGRL